MKACDHCGELQPKSYRVAVDECNAGHALDATITHIDLCSTCRKQLGEKLGRAVAAMRKASVVTT